MDNAWNPLKHGRYGRYVSHPMFVDDIILVIETFNDHAIMIKDILDRLFRHSGQQVGLPKHNIFFIKKTSIRPL